MDKEDVVCIYIVKYYLAIKKGQILSFAMWMDLEIIMLSEKVKDSIITYMLNLKTKTNDVYNKTETNLQI